MCRVDPTEALQYPCSPIPLHLRPSSKRTSVMCSAGSVLNFRENNEPEDELEPWVDRTVRATHKADDLLAANGITSLILRQSGIYWKQAILNAKHHERRWTKLSLQLESSDGNLAERAPEAWRTGQEMGRRHQRIPTINQNEQRQRWLEMGLCGKRLCKQRTQE